MCILWFGNYDTALLKKTYKRYPTVTVGYLSGLSIYRLFRITHNIGQNMTLVVFCMCTLIWKQLLRKLHFSNRVIFILVILMYTFATTQTEQNITFY